MKKSSNFDSNLLREEKRILFQIQKKVLVGGIHENLIPTPLITSLLEKGLIHSQKFEHKKIGSNKPKQKYLKYNLTPKGVEEIRR